MFPSDIYVLSLSLQLSHPSRDGVQGPGAPAFGHQGHSHCPLTSCCPEQAAPHFPSVPRKYPPQPPEHRAWQLPTEPLLLGSWGSWMIKGPERLAYLARVPQRAERPSFAVCCSSELSSRPRGGGSSGLGGQTAGSEGVILNLAQLSLRTWQTPTSPSGPGWSQ